MKRLCTCIREPHGNSGLEGYQEGKQYRYRRAAADWNGRPYYCIWPLENLEYYDTCCVELFERCFTPAVLESVTG